jgi:hypothetical protein
MGTTQLRSEVEGFIKKADNRFLKMVHAMAVAYSQKEIVAYTTDGIPLTKEAYVKEIEEAENDVKLGKVMTAKELKKRISTWKKG